MHAIRSCAQVIEEAAFNLTADGSSVDSIMLDMTVKLRMLVSVSPQSECIACMPTGH